RISPYSSPHRRDPHSFPTRRSSDLDPQLAPRVAFAEVPEHGIHHSHQLCDLIVVHPGSPSSLYALRASHTGRTAQKLDTKSVERSEEHTSELQSREKLVCRLLLEKK